MTFQCLDCNQQIEGDPWRYDPLATRPTVMLRMLSSQESSPTSLICQRLRQHLFTRRAWSGDGKRGKQQKLLMRHELPQQGIASFGRLDLW
jgi:hypothetical protein